MKVTCSRCLLYSMGCLMRCRGTTCFTLTLLRISPSATGSRGNPRQAIFQLAILRALRSLLQSPVRARCARLSLLPSARTSGLAAHAPSATFTTTIQSRPLFRAPCSPALLAGVRSFERSFHSPTPPPHTLREHYCYPRLLHNTGATPSTLSLGSLRHHTTRTHQRTEPSPATSSILPNTSRTLSAAHRQSLGARADDNASSAATVLDDPHIFSRPNLFFYPSCVSPNER